MTPMFKLKPYSVSALTLGGFLLVLLGIYFIFLRPPLLPEDPRYIGSTLTEISKSTPGLLMWLQKVFWVMGGYIFTTGLLTIYVAQTSFRARMRGALFILCIAGITSIGSMTVVNFILQSDFKWVLLSFTIPWFLAATLYLLKK